MYATEQYANSQLQVVSHVRHSLMLALIVLGSAHKAHMLMQGLIRRHLRRVCGRHQRDVLPDRPARGRRHLCGGHRQPHLLRPVAASGAQQKCAFPTDMPRTRCIHIHCTHDANKALTMHTVNLFHTVGSKAPTDAHASAANEGRLMFLRNPVQGQKMLRGRHGGTGCICTPRARIVYWHEARLCRISRGGRNTVDSQSYSPSPCMFVPSDS